MSAISDCRPTVGCLKSHWLKSGGTAGMGGLRTFRRVPPHQEETFNRRNWRRSVRRLISVFCVLGRPNVTALWRVLLLPWIGQWILAGIRSCGQAPRLSRKRACHDDASVQQGQVDNPGATSAPVHLTSCRGTTARNMRDNAPPNERRVRQTAQRAGPAWANTARCCEQ